MDHNGKQINHRYIRWWNKDEDSTETCKASRAIPDKFIFETWNSMLSFLDWMNTFRFFAPWMQLYVIWVVLRPTKVWVYETSQAAIIFTNLHDLKKSYSECLRVILYTDGVMWSKQFYVWGLGWRLAAFTI